MRQYARTQSRQDVDRQRYNKRLAHARKTADIAFRMLFHNYPLYQKKIALKPSNVENMILATCCLHNFLRDELNEFDENHKPFSMHIHGLPGNGGNSTHGAMYIKDQFKNYFAANNIKNETCSNNEN